MSPTRARDLTARLCESGDLARALETARDIRDPWFRCQALAFCAKENDRPIRLNLLREAFDSAIEQKEPNRIVSVSAWPLGVLCEFGDNDELSLEVDRLILINESEQHPVRRADSLFYILRSIHKGPWHITKRVNDAFRTACESGHGWKRDRDLRDASAWIAAHDHNEAMRLIDLIGILRVRRQALRNLPAKI